MKFTLQVAVPVAPGASVQLDESKEPAADPPAEKFTVPVGVTAVPPLVVSTTVAVQEEGVF